MGNIKHLKEKFILVSLGDYGKKQISTFMENKENRFGNLEFPPFTNDEYGEFEILNNIDITTLLSRCNEVKYNKIIILIGDLEDKETYEFLRKVNNLNNTKDIIGIFKNYKNEFNNFKNLLLIKSDEEVICFLENLLYLCFPSLFSADLEDFKDCMLFDEENKLKCLKIKSKDKKSLEIQKYKEIIKQSEAIYILVIAKEISLWEIAEIGKQIESLVNVGKKMITKESSEGIKNLNKNEIEINLLIKEKEEKR